MFISLLFSDPVSYFIIMLALILGLSVHEYFHAWVAYMLGDDTAKLTGRLTVNPLAHFDPIMTPMIFIVGVGAAKPVPINPSRVRHGDVGLFLISMAGIFANFVLALVCAFFFQFFVNNGSISDGDLLFSFLLYALRMNLVLLAFNLLPLPPLDGSKILLSLIPEQYKNIYSYFAQNQLISFAVAIIVFSYSKDFLILFFLKIIGFVISLFFG